MMEFVRKHPEVPVEDLDFLVKPLGEIKNSLKNAYGPT